MKITCQSCQAKYTIADDKVVGKTVKIKCKKCGSAIVVQGDAAQAAYAAQAEGDDGAETRVFSESAAAGAAPTGAGEWLVNVAEGDERSMTAAQIADEYARGTINHETYVWKDGMSDWLMLSTVPELMQAIAAQAPAPAQAAAPAYGHPAVQEPAMGLMGTVVMDSASAAAPMAAGAPRPVSTPPAAARPASAPPPAAAAAAAAPAAARRAVNRGGVDVFGAREQAEAVPVASPSAPPPGGSMTGQRNENSVLFSLSALTATENAVKAQEEKAVMEARPGPAGRPPPTRNGSSGARAGFDDIMNLGGGGIGSPMLAPPPVLAPVVEAPPPPPMPSVAPAMGMGAGAGMPMGMPDYPQPKKSPVGLIIGGVVALLVIGGVAAAALGVFSPKQEPVASNDPAPTSTQANPTPATTEAKPAETAPTEAKPAESAAAKPAETTTVAAATTPGGTKPGGPLPTGPGGAKPAEKEPPKEEKPAEPPKEEKPTTPPAGDSGAEFNRGAATSALGAAAGAAKGCKKPDGPTGTGKVKVTFAPSGNVTSAQVQGAPFAGTPVGGCVASAFRSARVPPFSGAPVSVTKSFTIN